MNKMLKKPVLLQRDRKNLPDNMEKRAAAAARGAEPPEEGTPVRQSTAETPPAQLEEDRLA